MWKRITDSLSFAGTLRDGFLVTAAVFYFFGYIVWAINAYQNDLGLLPALEFQYLVAGAPPVVIILVLCSIVMGAKLFNSRVRAWIGSAPTGWKLRLSWIMSFLGVGSLGLIFVSQADWVKTAFPTLDLSWLSFIVVLVILVTYPFLRPPRAARRQDQATQEAVARRPLQPLINSLSDLLDSWFGLLRLLYAIYGPLIIIILAALAFIYFLQLYPKIPQEFGGARPSYACLDLVKAQLSKETAEDLLPVGASQASDPVVRSSRVEILFSWSDVTLVRSHGRVRRVTKGIIQGVSACD
jgi:hypothetical protein